MVFGLKYYVDEARYSASKTMRAVQAKLAQTAVRLTMGGGAAAVATKFSAGGATALGTGEMILSAAGGLATAGIGIGIDVYQNQMRWRRSERQMTELYRPQIGSILGKDRGMVGVDDLYTVASMNPTLDEELHRHRQMRNVKNAAAVGSTLIAFGVVFASIALFPPLGAALAAGIFTGPGLVAAAAVGSIGFASIQLARRGIKNLGKKLLGLDHPSAEDKISELSKQHRREESIAPEQVLGVYAASLPELDQSIKDQFGRGFDDLAPEKQKEALVALDPQFNFTGIADALNTDRMNVRELVFSAHGQSSGVYPDPSLKDKIKNKAQDAIEAGQDKLAGISQEATERFQDVRTGVAGKVDQLQDWRDQRRQNKLQDKVAKALEEGRELPKEALDAAPESYWQAMVQQQRAQKAAEQGASGPAK